MRAVFVKFKHFDHSVYLSPFGEWLSRQDYLQKNCHLFSLKSSSKLVGNEQNVIKCTDIYMALVRKSNF